MDLLGLRCRVTQTCTSFGLFICCPTILVFNTNTHCHTVRTCSAQRVRLFAANTSFDMDYRSFMSETQMSASVRVFLCCLAANLEQRTHVTSRLDQKGHSSFDFGVQYEDSLSRHCEYMFSKRRQFVFPSEYEL